MAGIRRTTGSGMPITTGCGRSSPVPPWPCGPASRRVAGRAADGPSGSGPRRADRLGAAVGPDQPVRREAYGQLSERAGRSPAPVGTAGQALLVRYESADGLLSARVAMDRVRALLEEPADLLAESILLGAPAAAAVALWADELDEAERLVERGLAGQRASLLYPMHGPLLNVRADIAAALGGYAGLIVGPDTRQTRRQPATGNRQPAPADTRGCCRRRRAGRNRPCAAGRGARGPL